MIVTQNLTLIVTYSLHNRRWNYQPFYDALKKQGAWWHICRPPGSW